MFRYNAYWGNWSRVLVKGRPQLVKQVEIDLTPISGHEWDERLRSINVRLHSTPPRSNDVFVPELPKDVEAQMRANLGDELANKMLGYRFIDEIDWALYQRNCNGGASFASIQIPLN